MFFYDTTAWKHLKAYSLYIHFLAAAKTKNQSHTRTLQFWHVSQIKCWCNHGFGDVHT